jgi:hypothetical protein
MATDRTTNCDLQPSHRKQLSIFDVLPSSQSTSSGMVTVSHLQPINWPASPSPVRADTQPSDCLHPRAYIGLDSAICPDCGKTMNADTPAYASLLHKSKPLPLPPEQSADDFEALTQQLASLQQERDRILKEGAIAEKGVWIETCTLHQRNGWQQAMWKSDKPIFHPKRQHNKGGALGKTQYIGKVGSSAHQQAQAAIARRRQLTRIDHQIAEIQSLLDKFP